jgi:hypothetical protein
MLQFRSTAHNRASFRSNSAAVKSLINKHATTTMRIAGPARDDIGNMSAKGAL